MGPLSTKENKEKYLFILAFQLHIHYKPHIKNIMHPMAFEKLVVFFQGISVSITIIYFADINIGQSSLVF